MVDVDTAMRASAFDSAREGVVGPGTRRSPRAVSWSLSSPMSTL